MDVAQAARQHLQLQNTIHWIKSIAIDKDAAGAAAALDEDLAVGHYKPINSDPVRERLPRVRLSFHAAGRTPLDRRRIGVPYQDASNIARWRTRRRNRRCRGNTWFIPYDTIQSRDKDRPHPATFPAAARRNTASGCTALSRSKLAMDPFLGLGSSAVARARLDIDFVGIEIDEHYLATGVQRVNEELKPARLVRIGDSSAPESQAAIGTVLRKTGCLALAAALAGAACGSDSPSAPSQPPQPPPTVPATRFRRSPTATPCGSRPRSRARRSCGCCTSTPRRPPRLPGANNHAPS